MRLVVCDDHQLLLDALGSALTARGFVVEALVTTGDLVLEAVRTTDPDVAIIDVHLASGDGLAVAADIAVDHPRTKVLLMSASSDLGVVRAAIDAGASGFVRKDQSVDEIVRRLQLLGSGAAAFDLGALRTAMRGPARLSPAHELLRRLSRREREVLRLIVDGRDTAEIAGTLHIAESTARTHVQNVLVKVGAHSRLQAAAIAVQMGVTDLLPTVPEPRDPGSRAGS